jgi:hypothetical protein
MIDPDSDTVMELLRRLEIKLDAVLNTEPAPPAERVMTHQEVTATLIDVRRRVIRLEVNVEYLQRDQNTLRREHEEL